MSGPLIDCLVFSKDRPAQLDLLLRSIQKHAPSLYHSVVVLWTYSSTDFKRGYVRCQAEHADECGWQSEGALGDPLRTYVHHDIFDLYVNHWLKLCGPVVSFLCDDDVFYRDAQEPGELPWSYRGGDYDYPFSLDGNVYAKADVEKLLRGLHFMNPTELEHQGHLHRDRLPFTEVAHGTPCLVGIPANRVSSSSGMPHMGQHEYDLNERYLAGERLAFPFGWGSVPAGAHANIELLFDEATTDVGQAATTQGWLL